MSDVRYGALGDAKKAVRAYIHEHLAISVASVDAEPAFQLEVDFARFLRTRGVEENLASELSAEQYALVERKVSDHVNRWFAHGLAPPLGFQVDNEKTIITWRHDRYEELTGHVPIPETHFKAAGWIADHLNRAFLLPCACYLRALGCDPIFITDGARDEGIDLIGLIRGGPLRSMVLYVQAKSQSRMSGDELLREFSKFASLPQTDKHLRYLDALGVSRLKDGASFVYLCLVNGDFDFAAETHGRNLGALLRSRRQIADQLSQHYSQDRLDQLGQTIVMPTGADLGRNLAPVLSP
ncbi:hypothetical protein KRZ98_12235 [Sphingobium sp. AS12]|uniref:restriction endonuclease n=1 Tax=Sphingobium sp. AS12 TaxID=2849495 RepID=UPI001C312900|nr:restriction endonuclease [Sphingobium sp. AS12]MBV2149048.1 hypothetical protein [Sphingobium sp. AS12]